MRTLVFALALCLLLPARLLADGEDTLSVDLEPPDEEDGAQAAASDNPRPMAFGAGLDFYVDDGEQTIERVNSGGGDLSEGRESISNDGSILGMGLGLALWMTAELQPNLALGGSVRLLGSYAYELDDADDGSTVELGQLIELGPRVSYLIPITDTLSVPLGAEAALAVVFPSDDLAARIDTLDAQGFDATGAPRLGAVLGPHAGLRYGLEDWLALRAEVAYLWTWLYLLDASASAGGLRGQESWDVDWTRLRVHLGAELAF